MCQNGSSRHRHFDVALDRIVRLQGLRALLPMMMVAVPLLLQSTTYVVAQPTTDAVRELVARTDYRARLSHFDEFPIRRGEVVFLGDQLIHSGAWSEFFTGVSVRNRGIVGDRADALLLRLQHVVGKDPAAIVLHIGVNDVVNGADVPTALARIEQVLIALGGATAPDRLLVIGLPPLTPVFSRAIRDYNDQLRKLVLRYNNVYVDIYDPLVGRQGAIFRDYTIDGRVLSGRGYRVVAETLLPHLIKIAGEQRQAASETDRLTPSSITPNQ